MNDALRVRKSTYDPGPSDSFRFVYLGVAVETGLIRLVSRGIQKLKVSVTDLKARTALVLLIVRLLNDLTRGLALALSTY